LKKRSKKLLPIYAQSNRHTPQPNGQKFFASFFQKRSAFFLCFTDQSTHVNDRLGKRLRRLLRQIMPDAAGDGPV
jgi:hypothetical protein